MQLRSDWFKDEIDTGNYFPYSLEDGLRRIIN